MFSPRDGAVRWIWDLPEGDMGRMLSLLRKTKKTAERAGVWQSTDPGEQDLALCALSAAWQEISRCLPGYFDPGRELDKGWKLPERAAAARKRPADCGAEQQKPEQRKRPALYGAEPQKGSGEADRGAWTADLIAEMAISGAKTSV